MTEFFNDFRTFNSGPVYTGSDLKIFACTQNRIRMDPRCADLHAHSNYEILAAIIQPQMGETQSLPYHFGYRSVRIRSRVNRPIVSYRFNLVKASVSNVKDVQRQLSNQHSSTFFATFLCQDTGEHDKKPDTDN